MKGLILSVLLLLCSMPIGAEDITLRDGTLLSKALHLDFEKHIDFYKKFISFLKEQRLLKDRVVQVDSRVVWFFYVAFYNKCVAEGTIEFIDVEDKS